MSALTSKVSIDKILSKPQGTVFQQLKSWSKNWYLSGGTALTLQLAHRRSFDFDLFSQEKIPTNLREQAVKVFGQETRFTMDTRDQLTLMTRSAVKVTFAYTPYKPLYALTPTSAVPLAKIADIAAEKAFTIGRRGAYRDYVDLYFILKTERGNLSQTISDAKSRYQALFDEKLFLEQLDYLEDLKELTIEFIGTPVQFGEVKHYLHQEIKTYLRRRQASLE